LETTETQPNFATRCEVNHICKCMT